MEKNINSAGDSPLTPQLSHYCMTARCHSGDENGMSSAKFAALVVSEEAKEAGYGDAWLVFEDYAFMKESSSSLVCQKDPAVVITGREHTGDENGTTYYQLGRVMVWRKKDGEDEKVIQTCVADDFVEITNEKESKAGWVESEGRVMVGRTHKGDENGKTVTTFARIYIVDDKDGKRYPLELANVKELDGCKESKSDFSVDCPDFENVFTAWAAPAFKQEWMNHTWVKSRSPEDRFCCAGGTGEDYFLREVGVKKDAHKIMNECRGGVVTKQKDCAGVIYMVQGVCHQMSNRFLYPVSGKYMVYNNGHPKGYSKTRAAYGPTGFGYEAWYKYIYLPAERKFNGKAQEQEDMAMIAYDRERELEKLRNETAAVFEELGITVPGSVILEAQREWLARREEIMKKYNFMAEDGTEAVPDGLTEETVRAMAGEVIDAQRIFFTAVRDKIGQDNFRLFNDGEDEIVDIADVDTALEFFLG